MAYSVIIRKAILADLDTVIAVCAVGRELMCESGNPDQWPEDYPPRATIEDDIRSSNSYICEENGEIKAVFCLAPGPDSTYTKIDGAWLNDEPYGVVHRIARTREAKGAGAFCLNWCFDQLPNIRIDTHRDNIPMLKLMEKLGYVRCGIIWLDNGDERIAFQKVV